MTLNEFIKILEDLRDEHGGGVWVENHTGSLMQEEQVEIQFDEIAGKEDDGSTTVLDTVAAIRIGS